MIDQATADALRRAEITIYRRHRDGWKTYAIACGEFVKVGKSKDVNRRIQSLRTSNPLPIVLLGIIDGDWEDVVHAELVIDGVRRVRGEWFEYTEIALQYLRMFGLHSVADGPSPIESGWRP